MGWLGRKQMKNTAATTFAAPPPRQTINEARTPWETLLILVAVIIGLAIILAWYGFVFLLDRAGYSQPDKVLAESLITFVVLIPVVVLLAWAGGWLIGQWLDYQRLKVEAGVQIAEIQYSAAQQLPPTTAERMTSEDKRKYKLIMAVMTRTFSVIDEAGNIRGSGEPYSRRRAGALVLMNERTHVGSTLGGWVRPWLLDHKILLDDRTVNIAEFPNLTAVQTALINDPKY